jgi:hypothetical protein
MGAQRAAIGTLRGARFVVARGSGWSRGAAGVGDWGKKHGRG